jgi:hypothetical protein
MRLAIAVPEPHVTKPVLDAALEASTRFQTEMVRNGEVPTFRKAVGEGRVKWHPEPPGDERFDHARTVLGRGWGDCDDLGPWHAASLRATGEDPGARAVVKRSGPRRWHVIVQRSDGSVQDPSKAAGMHGAKGVVVGQLPPSLAPMTSPASSVVGGPADWRPVIAVRPVLGGSAWESRVDVPTGVMVPHWSRNDWALSALNRAPVAHQALYGAMVGACAVGKHAGCDPKHLRKLRALSMLCKGHAPARVASVCGEEATLAALEVAGAMNSVGFNFGKLFNKLAPFVSKIARFVPFVGPVVSTALDVVTDLKLVPDGDGGGGGGKLKLPKVNIPGVGPIASLALDLGKQMVDQRLRSSPAPSVRPAPAQAPRPVVPVRVAPAPRPAPAPVPVAFRASASIAIPPHMAALEAFPGGHIVLRF